MLTPRGGIVGPFPNAPYPIDLNGRFEIRGVAPGSYFLQAQIGGKSARQLIEVGNSNIDDLNLTAGPTFAVQGRVRIDPDRVRQVVWNMVHNAVKFTPPGGNVTVGLQRTGDTLRIEVKDTGQGIPSSFLKWRSRRI